MKLGNLQGVTCRGVLGRYCRGLITCKGHKTNNLQVVTCRVLQFVEYVTAPSGGVQIFFPHFFKAWVCFGQPCL